MATELPGTDTRWRCAGCGNLTRFDVEMDQQTREFWHFDLKGDFVVEDTQVHARVARVVTCRWCGRDDAVELVPRTDHPS